MNILVAGGDGFIGRNLVKDLKKDKHEVTVIDKNSYTDAKSHIWKIDMSDQQQMDDFFETRKFDAIYHLASETWKSGDDGKDWISSNSETFRTNVMGTYNLVKNCKKTKIIFASTANIYGEGRRFREKSSINISSTYGYSKYVAEQIIIGSDVPYTILRFATVVGGGGKCFPNRLVWCAVHNEDVQIFCLGKTLRSFIDVQDAVSALRVAYGLGNNIYNIAGKHETSGEELVSLVKETARNRGYKLPYVYVSWKAKGYIVSSTLSISKILRTKVWEPKISLGKTISSLFDYYEQKNKVIPPRWDEL